MIIYSCLEVSSKLAPSHSDFDSNSNSNSNSEPEPEPEIKTVFRKGFTEEAVIYTNKKLIASYITNCPTLTNIPNLLRTLLTYLSRYPKELLCLFILLFSISKAESLSIYGLQAVTSKYIEGNAPYLVLPDGKKVNNVDDLFSITIPKEDGGEGRETIDSTMSDKVIKIPEGMKLSDIEVIFGKADGKNYSLKDILTVGDADGDEGYADGFMTASWFDALGVIPESDYGKELDSCGGPYELRVTIPARTKISAVTSYGYPVRETVYHDSSTVKEVKYRFELAKQKICYLSPYNMTVHDETDLNRIKYSGGYNPEVWSVLDRGNKLHSGFKVDSGFPTTGFKGASFTLKGTGSDQSKYHCSSLNGSGKIMLTGDGDGDSGKNCNVTYLSKTKGEFIAGGTPIIKMEYDTGEGNRKEIGSFQIPVPKKWAIYKGRKEYGNGVNLSFSTVFPALDLCRGVPEGTTTKEEATGQSEEARAFRLKYLYRRDELTSSPMTNLLVYPEGNGNEKGQGYVYISRDLGGFIDEWGDFSVDNDHYFYMWLAGAYDSDFQYAYWFNNGHNLIIGENVSIINTNVICRGD